MSLFTKPTSIHLIGRVHESEEIQQYARAHGTEKVYFIQAAGGIGKTRLLEEIGPLLREEPDLFVAKTIDFDDPKNHIPLYLATSIAASVGQSESFHATMKDLRTSEKLPGFKSLSSQTETVANDLAATINSMSVNQRIIFRFDTFEKLPTALRGQLLSWLAGFKNILVIIAGRPVPDKNDERIDVVREDIKTIFGHNSKVRTLKELSGSAAREFLTTMMPELSLPENHALVTSIVSMTQGRPILLALAIEWLVRENPPVWLKHPNKKLPPGIDPGDEFKKSLVKHINRLRDPMDRLVHVLSRVYPLDVEMAQVMLALSRQEAIALFHEALTYFFIKLLPDDRLTLHDEMRGMVEQLVWPDVMERVPLEQLYSARAYQAIAPKLVKIDQAIADYKSTSIYDFEKNTLLAEREQYLVMGMSHLVASDSQKGFLEILAVVNSERDAVEFGRQLLEIARPYRKAATEEARFRFDLTSARLSSKEESPAPEHAKQHLLRMLEKFRNNPERIAYIKNTLAGIEVQLGNLDNALEHQNQTYTFVTESRPDDVPSVANQIGYYFRLKRDLAEALDWYQKALIGARELKPLRHSLVAGILNNLAYAQGLYEFEDDARYNCHVAIDLWLSSKTPRLAGRAYTTLGILARDSGSFDESLAHFKRALEQFKEPDDREDICRTLFHQAWALWFKWENQNLAQIFRWEQTQQAQFNDLSILEDARDAFEQSKRYAENYQLNRELPGIYHQMSNVYWWLGNADLPDSKKLAQIARATNRDARKLSARYRDIRYAIDSLVGDAEYDFDTRSYGEIFNLGSELRTKFKDYEQDFSLYFGRMERIEADVYFERKEFAKAKERYARGLGQLSSHGGYGRYSIDSELERLDLRLTRLPREVALEWISFFKKTWSDLPINRPNLEPSSRRIRGRQKLLAWCGGQMTKTVMREG